MIYDDSSDVLDSNSTMLVEPERSRVRERVRLPSLSVLADSTWDVRLWTLFSGATTEFQCLISGPAEPLNIAVTALTSVK